MKKLQPKPEKTLRQRLLDWCQYELQAGVRAAAKPAVNNGPRVRDYLAGCMRDGSNGVGRWLATEGGNWCSASQGCALDACKLSDDILPHEWRAGVVEMMGDAADRELWVSAADWKAGDTRPQAGDLALWTRPGASWHGHVNRVTEFLGGGNGWTKNAGLNLFTTIGGNEYRAWRVKDQTRQRIDDRLRGFVLHPEPGGRHPLTLAEQSDLRAQVVDFTNYLSNDLII